MTILQSNADALLVAIPMVGILFACHFRVDELFGKSRKRGKQRRPMAGSDLQGRPICADPDGSVPTRVRKR